MTGQLQVPTAITQALPNAGYKVLVVDVPLTSRNADDWIDLSSYFQKITGAIGYGIASGSTTAASVVEGEFFSNTAGTNSTSLFVYIHTATISQLIVTGQ